MSKVSIYFANFGPGFSSGVAWHGSGYEIDFFLFFSQIAPFALNESLTQTSSSLLLILALIHQPLHIRRPLLLLVQPLHVDRAKRKKKLHD